MRKVGLLILLLCGCSSGGSNPYFYSTGGDDGGDGASKDGGPSSHADLSSPAAQPDLTMATAPEDLASEPPDLASQPQDLSVPCKPGHYTGPLMGTATLMGVSAPLSMGTVDLTLGPPQNGVLAISNGRMTATGPIGSTFSADMVGGLDCGTRALTATLQNGKAFFLGQNLPFTGTASATYDENARALTNGVWTATGAFASGSGTWSAM